MVISFIVLFLLLISAYYLTTIVKGENLGYAGMTERRAESFLWTYSVVLILLVLCGGSLFLLLS